MSSCAAQSRCHRALGPGEDKGRIGYKEQSVSKEESARAAVRDLLEEVTMPVVRRFLVNVPNYTSNGPVDAFS